MPDIKYGNRIHVLPYYDRVEGLTVYAHTYKCHMRFRYTF